MRAPLLFVLAALLLAACGDDAGIPPVGAPWRVPGFDAGLLPDAGSDAGLGGSDGGQDAGFDAGFDGGQDAGPPPKRQDLHFLYVHGAAATANDRQLAHNQLQGLQTYLEQYLPDRLATYASQRPDVAVNLRHVRANLYTGPTGAVMNPSIDSLSDGTGVATGNRWRTRIAEELTARFDGGERNIILVGHGLGAKASLELAASDAGVATRIAGVVALHAMVDALNDSTYDVNGSDSYVDTCKSTREAGFCEYSGLVDSTTAANRVATRKRSLVLVGYGSSCPSGWTAEDDGVVPFRAMGSPDSVGMTMTVAPGETFLPAHGLFYGNHCHRDLIDPGAVAHDAAVSAAGDQILRFVFESARRVTDPGMAASPVEIPTLSANTWSSWQTLQAGCPAGEDDLDQPQVDGVCRHPGTFDGDDHPVNNQNELAVDDGLTCGGRFRFRHLHGGDDQPARLWAKTYSTLSGLIFSLPLSP